MMGPTVTLFCIKPSTLSRVGNATNPQGAPNPGATAYAVTEELESPYPDRSRVLLMDMART
jgi:hypothetical protein